MKNSVKNNKNILIFYNDYDILEVSNDCKPTERLAKSHLRKISNEALTSVDKLRKI